VASHDSGSVKSVQRAMRLLSILIEQGDRSLSELAAATSLVPSTVHRLLGTLVDSGYVRQDPVTRRYAPGFGLLEFADRAEQQVTELRAVAVPEMRRLADDCRETVLLTVLDRREVVFIEQILGTGLVRMEVAPGRRMPAHVTAAGKALLAWQSPERLERLIEDGELEAFTAETVADADKLKRELERVRRRGWAIDYEEQEAGVACVGAPILQAGGAPLASLSVSGPTSRLRRRALNDLGEQLLAAASRIATRMGSRSELPVA
jgi:DNA-binding IclR family transcriptional regulator